MSDVLNIPPLKSQLAVEGSLAAWSQPWANWLMQAYRILFAVSQSGTTAQRPTENLYVGRMYYDTSLGAKGKPIWRNKTNDGWVLADGTAA